jgi:hypothetical protein
MKHTVFILMLALHGALAQPNGMVAGPAVVAVKRSGITGAGFATVTADGERVTLHYPIHPDDFGISSGTGTAISTDGGRMWSVGTDDWPIAKMVDLWQERMVDGSLMALGIRWLPDPKWRGQIEAKDIPAKPWSMATSKDGQNWQTFDVTIHPSPEVGVIARPLPHIMEADNGVLLMPAYAWGKGGTRAVLLKSDDRGLNWSVLSTIATASVIVKRGVPVTTPWLENMVARAADGSLLAIIRTGSSAESALVSARSKDGGRTWSVPEKVIAGEKREAVTGKLPNVLALPNGMMALLTAHTKRGCFLHLSRDGMGRDWGEGQLITKVTGGNTSMVLIDASTMLVFTPANGRINCWRITLPQQ